ncbi:MAG TPA: hypothetical protein PLA51_00045 [Spirochaetota bacterium]|nr:hypothetical protein [Spirochaetota bacterium]
MIQKIYLILKELAGNKFISFIVFSVITISVIITISFLVISSNFNSYIKHNFATSIPPDEILVKQGKSKGFFLFSENSGRPIDEEALKKIKSLKGVEKINPVIAVAVPTSATISFFTFNYRSDLICAGADYKFVEKNLTTPEIRQAWKRGDYEKGIPVLVPIALIDSYNNGLAAANDLPEIVPEKIAGLKFRITFGLSSLSYLPGYFEKQAIIAGYTEKINLTGLIIPMKAAQEINAHFGKENRYIFAYIKVKDHKWTESVKKQIQNLKLSAETGTSLSPQIIALQRSVNYFITVMIGLVITLASVAVALCSATAVWDRIEYYRILRILGSTKIFIAFTILLKNALSGFAAFWIGLFVMKKISIYIMNSLSLSIPGFKFQWILQKEHLFAVAIVSISLPVISSLPAIIRMFSSKLDHS